MHRSISRFVPLVALVLFARLALAQAPSGAVEGTVIDSIHRVPLVDVVVAAGSTMTASLAIPSSLTLRRALCPISVRDSSLGMILGVVRRAGGGTVPRATVVFAWGDFDIAPGTAIATPKGLTAHVTADSAGVYRACGLPLAHPLSIQVQAGPTEQSGVIEEEIGERGIRVLDLRLGSESTPSAVGVPSIPSPDAGQLATTIRHAILGRVRGESGSPITSAHVRLFGTTLESVTDEQGDFRLAGLPDGTQGIEVVALGYEPRRVSVDVGADVAPVIVTLRRASVVLDSVLVTARRSSRSVSKANLDFDARARRGANKYFTEEQIAQRHPFFTTDMLTSVPGMRVIRNHFDITIVSTRGSINVRSSQCPVDVFVDGIRSSPDDIADLPPQQVHGMEIVSSSIGSPPGYPVGACGAIFVWTK